MDQASLHSFIQVAKERSFSRAAEKLHITQPAISKRIANLEQELNCQLFDRIGKDIQLTNSGRLFLHHASKLLEAMDDCITALHNLDNSISGELRLGVSHHIGLHRLPPYLRKFSQQYPRVQLKISFVDSEKAYQMVNNGELEVALATLAPEHKLHIEQKCVWNDPLTFMVSDDHKLAYINQRRPLQLTDLAEHPAILPGKDTYTGQLIQQHFHQEKIAISHFIETNYLETIRMMISIGLGWAVLPRTMLNNQLRGLNIENTSLHRKLGYIHHTSRTLSNASKAFIATISD